MEHPSHRIITRKKKPLRKGDMETPFRLFCPSLDLIFSRKREREREREREPWRIIHTEKNRESERVPPRILSHPRSGANPFPHWKPRFFFHSYYYRYSNIQQRDQHHPDFFLLSSGGSESTGRSGDVRDSKRLLAQYMT